MSDVQPIPAGFNTVTPHLIIKDAAQALEFYQRAFGAENLGQMLTPDGKKVIHGMMRIGDSMVMLTDEFPECLHPFVSPKTNQGTTITMHLYVDDADAAYQRAVDAGCTPNMPPMDAFWGDRYGQVFDPFGHAWSIASHHRDVTPQEMEQAAAQMFQ